MGDRSLFYGRSPAISGAFCFATPDAQPGPVDAERLLFDDLQGWC